MLGVMTNLSDWIFTRYDMIEECNREAGDLKAEPFQFSRTYKVMDVSAEEVSFRRQDFFKVIQIIRNFKSLYS